MHEELCGGMVMADVTSLDRLLADTFTLTHITGYVQSRADWLKDIDTGEMRYHSIGTVEVAVDTKSGMPRLTARTLTDATIWGSPGSWRLQLRSSFERSDDRWIIPNTVASTW